MSQPVAVPIQPEPQASTSFRDAPLWPRMPESPLPILEAAEEHEQNPVRWRELLSCLLIVALCDLTIYHGQGLVGLAMLFVAGPLLLFFGVSQRKLDASVWIIGPMLLLSTVRMLWCGSWLNVVVGFPLLAAFAMSLSGLRPYVLDLLAFGVQSIFFGFGGIPAYRRAIVRGTPNVLRMNWFAIGLPMLALTVFGLLFLAANPDVWKLFTESVSRFFDNLSHWLGDFAPSVTQVMFWLFAGCVTIGWLRPATEFLLTKANFGHARTAPVGEPATDAPLTARAGDTPEAAPLFAAFRNTLLALIALFAFYLAFEFQTLWFRVFPKGFHYSGYAHEGAAWLTIALGLATVVLSVIFRGAILDDTRLNGLRRLAWIWSAENMILALAVYHRLLIYVGFNGMTRMRVVGFYGMSAVVIGFVLVLRKIAGQHSFTWLLRRQIATLAAAIFLYSITPVDALVMQYNVRRIMAGESAPAVQIGFHDIDSEGLLCLLPLVDCPDEKIREGIKALLSERHDALVSRNWPLGWKEYQIADQRLKKQLRAATSQWPDSADYQRRMLTLDLFREYVYQWY